MIIMKKKTKAFLSILLTASMLIGSSLTVFGGELTGISVTGKGSISVAPDVATISLAVETTGKTAKEAQTKNATTYKNVIKNLTEAGIEEGAITTASFRVLPTYRYDEKLGQVPTGYECNHHLSVTTKDTKNVGSYIDAAISAGAINDNGVSFSLSDYNQYYEKALVLAVKNATGKANAIATTIGKKVTVPLSITEQSYAQPYLRQEYNKAMAAVAEDSSSNISTTITSDKIEVKASISAVYGY